MAQESMSGKVAVIGGGRIRGIGVTRLIVDFGVWHKRVCQVRAVFIRGGGIDKMGGMRTSMGFSKGDYWGVYT